MALPPYVQPTTDFSVGYTVQPSDWNSNFDGITAYLNTTVKPAIDSLTAGGIPVVGAQGIAQGRLTLQTGTPIPSSDLTNLGNIIYTPYNGGQLGTYNGSYWVLNTFVETTLSLTGLLQWQNYDIFGYFTGGVLTLEADAWASATATNSPTAGSSVVINVASTTNVAVGDLVTISGGGNIEVCLVTAVSGTSFTVATLVHSYTTPAVYFTGTLGRATALTFLNGVPLKSTQQNKIYLGTIRCSGAGTCTDSATSRYVWNYWNRVPRHLYANDTTSSWNYTTQTWRAANANTTLGQARVDMVTGLGGEMVRAHYTANASNGNSAQCATGVGVNSTSVNSAQVFGGAPDASQQNQITAFYKGYGQTGYNFLQSLEQSVASGTTIWHGSNGSTVEQSGLEAEVRC